MMSFNGDNILLILSILLFSGIVAGRTGYKYGIPALLLFLFVGMLFGSDGLGLEFYDPNKAQFIGMVALSIILFNGGMDTKKEDIRPILGPGIMLSTVGVVLTALFTGLFIWLLSWLGCTELPLTLAACLLLASTMASTDSASVFGLLRSQNIHLKNNLRPVLELESGSNDPMAYMLTIVLTQYLTLQTASAWEIFSSFMVQFIVGGAMGYGMGRLSSWLLNNLNVGNTSFYPIMLLSLVFFTFSVTDLLNGNAYLAVYIAGLLIGNNRLKNRKELYTFIDGLSWLFQIIMFICLGLLVNPIEMVTIAPFALLIAVFLTLVARPAGVFISLLPFKHFSLRSKIFVSWVGLRGAVPIIFATYPVIAGIPGAKIMFNTVFFVTIISLVVQGSTISNLAHKLRLAAPMPKVGNDFGVELPDEIDSDLHDVMVTEKMLAQGNTLKEMNLPAGTLVMIVKRGDEYLVPNGTLKLHLGDKLLLISDKRNEKKE